MKNLELVTHTAIGQGQKQVYVLLNFSPHDHRAQCQQSAHHFLSFFKQDRCMGLVRGRMAVRVNVRVRLFSHHLSF